MTFFGRKTEVEELRSWYRQAQGSQLGVVYGRRRVGKTRLIEESFQDENFIKFEGLEGKPTVVQQKNFLRRFSEVSEKREYRLIQSRDWIEILQILSEWLGTKKTVLFFDEFQWMAAERNELVSALKYVWDNSFSKKNNIHLILCGSISSFFIKKVIGSKALYGRVDLEMSLTPLKIREVSEWLTPQRSLAEVIEFYFFVGGIPQYLKMIDPTCSVHLNMERLCFRKKGPLLKEFDRIFISHFAKNTHYKKILEIVAKKPFLSREEIQKQSHVLSGGTLSLYLEELEQAGFLEKYSSVNKPKAQRLIRFRLCDPYLLFYFRFIEPVQKKIELSSTSLPLSQLLPEKRYQIWRGLAFEFFCYQHSALIAEKLGFGGIRYDVGPYFSRPDLKTGVQIDLLFIRADQVMTLCEMKFRENKIGPSVIPEIEKKIQRLPNRQQWTIEKVLVTKSEATEELKRTGYFYRILGLNDCF